MRRSVAEAVLTIVLSVGIAVAVFAAGTAAMQPPPPPASRREPPDLHPGAFPGVPVGAQSADLSWRASGACRGVSVVEHAGARMVGKASLCEDVDGLHAAMEVDVLVAGDAYALWFAYFERASACAGPRCDLGDALGHDPVGVLARLDGAVATAGRGQFRGLIRDLPPGIGSQTALLLIGHGRASAVHTRARARQLLTPRSPALGAPLGGATADGEAGRLVAQATFELRPDP